MNILGISAYYHDSATCPIRDGKVLCAAHEERFTRKKHDSRFPESAVGACLRQGGSRPANCVANGRILREGPFDRVWIQPAAGDAGGALGAALFVWYQYLGNARQADDKNDLQQGSYWGPGYDNGYAKAFFQKHGIPFQEYSDNELYDAVADLMIREKVIGWFNGPMEFGPRALGSRSIIGDARSPKMQSVMNLKIKQIVR